MLTTTSFDENWHPLSNIIHLSMRSVIYNQLINQNVVRRGLTQREYPHRHLKASKFLSSGLQGTDFFKPVLLHHYLGPILQDYLDMLLISLFYITPKSLCHIYKSCKSKFSYAICSSFFLC